MQSDMRSYTDIYIFLLFQAIISKYINIHNDFSAEKMNMRFLVGIMSHLLIHCVLVDKTDHSRKFMQRYIL